MAFSQRYAYTGNADEELLMMESQHAERNQQANLREKMTHTQDSLYVAVDWSDSGEALQLCKRGLQCAGKLFKVPYQRRHVEDDLENNTARDLYASLTTDALRESIEDRMHYLHILIVGGLQDVLLWDIATFHAQAWFDMQKELDARDDAVSASSDMLSAEVFNSQPYPQRIYTSSETQPRQILRRCQNTRPARLILKHNNRDPAWNAVPDIQIVGPNMQGESAAIPISNALMQDYKETQGLITTLSSRPAHPRQQLAYTLNRSRAAGRDDMTELTTLNIFNQLLADCLAPPDSTRTRSADSQTMSQRPRRDSAPLSSTSLSISSRAYLRPDAGYLELES